MYELPPLGFDEEEEEEELYLLMFGTFSTNYNKLWDNLRLFVLFLPYFKVGLWMDGWLVSKSDYGWMGGWLVRLLLFSTRVPLCAHNQSMSMDLEFPALPCLAQLVNPPITQIMNKLRNMVGQPKG